MQTGIATTSGEWFCMIDADCRQISPRTLSVAMQYALDKRADMLSVLPTLEMKGFWENVVQPVCGGVMMIWFHPDKVNNPRKPHAYANGAFMLMRRSAYQAVGTHEAVKDRLNEDMHMAALLKGQGLRLVVTRSSGLFMSRMYTSLKGIIRGWSRIFFGTFGTLRRLTISLLVLIIMGLLPYLAAALGLAMWAPAPGTAGGGSGISSPLSIAADNPWFLCGLMGLLAVTLQLSVMYRFYKLIGSNHKMFWSYPIGCAVAAYAVCISLMKLRKGARIVWRSTSYDKPA